MKYCPMCDEAVDEKSTVCSKCGYLFAVNREDENFDLELENKLKEASRLEEEANLAEKKALGLEISIGEGEKLQSSSKKLPRIAFAAVGVVIVIIASLFITGLMDKKITDKTSIAYASIGKDGTAYFTTENGIVAIKGDAQRGYSTPNQKGFVILDTSNDLYYYKSKDAEKEKIAGEVSEILAVRQEGCAYSTKKKLTIEGVLNKLVEDYEDGYTNYEKVKEVFEQTYSETSVQNAVAFYKLIIKREFPQEEFTSGDIVKYLFSAQKSVVLENADYTFAEDTLSAAGLTDGKKIILYKENSEQSAEAVNVGNEPYILAVSSDGNKVIWREIQDDHSIVYQSLNDNKEKLGDLGIKTLYSIEQADFFNKETGTVIGGSTYENIIISSDGNETVEVKLGDGKDVLPILAEEGTELQHFRGKISGIYLSTFIEDKVSNLYYIDTEGNKEKVLSNIFLVCGVRNGKIAYLDSYSDLYVADIEGARVQNEVKVTSDVDFAKVSHDGEYLYIGKEDDEQYTLYYDKLTAKDHILEKIANSVDKLYMTTNDEIVYYTKNVQKIKDTNIKSGDLYEFSVGSEALKICSDVINLDSPYESDYVSTEHPVVKKYSYKDGDEIIYEMGVIDQDQFQEKSDEIQW